MADVTPGEKRWTLLFGSYEGIEKTAVTWLYREFTSYVNYMMQLHPAKDVDAQKFEHVLIIGSAATNPLIADLIAKKVIPAPPGEQGYTLFVGNTPWNAEHRMTVIAGHDARGVLYGVQELMAIYSAEPFALDKPARQRATLAKLADRVVVEAPVVKDRGIWTWGFVIYDYRRFIDNMVRLKMNMLTIWNSEVPQNWTEVANYAHERGIKIIPGFHWGWGYNDKDISKKEDIEFIKNVALDTYKREFVGKPHDGVYFQTLTEHKNQELNGRSIAAWCCDMVNDIAKAFYEIKPDLHIQFGLHATSIREHYVDLANLDPRIAIVWEDAGSLPYSYSPQPDFAEGYETTLAYSKKLAAFRPGSQFALVPKGWLSLRWDDEYAKWFTFMLGERNPAFLKQRLIDRQGELNQINDGWFRNYPLNARFYREVAEVNPNILSTALIEDVMFDGKIQPSMALLGETLWNPKQKDTDLLARAMRPYLNHTTV